MWRFWFLRTSMSDLHHQPRSRLPHLLRRSAAFAATAVLALTLFGCAKSPADQLVERSARRVEDGIALMLQAKGDESKLVRLAMRYRADHYAEIVQLRKDGDALGAKLPEVERRALEQQLQARIQPLLAKLQGESMRFPRPAKALLFLRPIVQVVTPRPRPDGKLPWLPEVPPLPPELGGSPVFPPGEPTPGSDPHGHGSDGHEHDQP